MFESRDADESSKEINTSSHTHTHTQDLNTHALKTRPAPFMYEDVVGLGSFPARGEASETRQRRGSFLGNFRMPLATLAEPESLS